MAGAEILDRSAVEILLDHGRAHVRRARYGGRVPELLGDPPHHGRNPSLGLGRILWGILLRQLDRRDQRAAPGAKVLRAEFRAEMLLDVLVQAPLVEVASASVGLHELEEP